MTVYHSNKTPASNALSDLIRAVLHMSATAERQGGKLTKSLEISSARWQTMAQLHWSAIPLTVSDVARNLGLSRQAVQRLCSDMASDGIVRFEPNAADARAKHVALTTKGSKLHAAALEREWAWTNAVSSGFAATELRRAEKLIVAVTKRMESEEIP